MLVGFVENWKFLYFFWKKKEIYIYYLAGYPVSGQAGYPVSGQAGYPVSDQAGYSLSGKIIGWPNQYPVQPYP